MITPITSQYNIPKQSPYTFTGRLVPAKVSRAYENTGFKLVLRPIMTAKAKKYSGGLFQSLEPIIQKVTLPLKKGSIYGWEVNPQNHKKYILFLHGIKGTSPLPPNQGLIERITALNKYGIITPEYRGSAELHNKKFTFKNMIEDANATLNYLCAKGIKPEDITIVAHCVGSIPAMQIAATKKNINKVILISPVVNGDGFGTALIKKLKLNVSKSFENTLNKFIKTFMPYDMNTTKFLQHTDAPITVIHPEEDLLIPRIQCDKFTTLIKNLEELIVVPKGGHSLNRYNITAILEQL